MADNAKWYVAHTYSGYENAVKTAIEKFVVNRGMEDMILDIQIPLEKVTEITETGAAKEVERKVFPGYVLVKMVMTDDTWHLVRNVRGVTGFVGEARNKPIPRWRRSTPRRTRSRSSCPCSGGRPPWSWSWTRWKWSSDPQADSFPSKLFRRVSGGVGGAPARGSPATTTFYQGGA